MSKVAVIRTKPETVLQDIEQAMRLAGFDEELDKHSPTILKNNLSWHLLYPAANTTPWQLEGVILAMKKAEFSDLVCVENETVVTSASRGERLNKQRLVCEKHHIPIKYNFKSSDMKWHPYQPQAEMLVLDKIFPDGIYIPDFFYGKNIVHLPTVKCHIYTNITGSMKNAFGGLLSNRRHYCHSRIHETLVDLLAIQKEIHPGIFTVSDGTTAGNGPGPRTMLPVQKDILIASADCVAADAVAARLMGFEPMEHAFIRLSHERRLGVGNLREIEILGNVDITRENWGFCTGNNAASNVGKLLWFGPLRWMQKLLFHTPLVYAFILASAVYHDRFWYPLRGKTITNQWLKQCMWGQLFENYD
ncbi:MAG: DUF362 domain-containing protein [Sedimentisphaerales bacterium]|nr:DUF362 domain-containing protein [Sedimentisphaerales bacterium]